MDLSRLAQLRAIIQFAETFIPGRGRGAERLKFVLAALAATVEFAQEAEGPLKKYIAKIVATMKEASSQEAATG